MLERTRFIVLTHRKTVNGEAADVDSFDELRFMLDEVGDGRIRSIESRGDAAGALIEIKVETAAEAQAFADSLPGVKAGIEKAVVIPLSEYRPFRALADALL